MKKSVFGILQNGTEVEKYTLSDGDISCEIITYGGAVKNIVVPDRNGVPTDIMLGYDTLDGYISKDGYIGSLIGRYANRIGGSSFELNGKTYQLFNNDGKNHLHGGRIGFDSQVWQVKSASDNSLTLTLFSPDGQEGYPGNMTVEVTYLLRDNSLSINYLAQSDKDTICNLTNHAYFNLSGHNSGTVEDNTMQIFAQYYTPTDCESITTGEIAEVENTPMDLREPLKIGKYADSDFQQLKWAGGYDHNWCIDGQQGTLRPAAVAKSEATGIVMKTYTTQAGVQFYCGNYLCGSPVGKGGAVYKKRSGFCLETQCYPDTPHHSSFPGCILKAGQIYQHTTVYKFETE